MIPENEKESSTKDNTKMNYFHNRTIIYILYLISKDASRPDRDREKSRPESGLEKLFEEPRESPNYP